MILQGKRGQVLSFLVAIAFNNTYVLSCLNISSVFSFRDFELEIASHFKIKFRVYCNATVLMSLLEGNMEKNFDKILKKHEMKMK